mmetsp:Transcript_4103/g.9727  ORF Transcript_4103/g.9727 Transcript_4103/m.9727 type:complete len:108 (-) Transcript_4103:962-1285(-)
MSGGRASFSNSSLAGDGGGRQLRLAAALIWLELLILQCWHGRCNCIEEVLMSLLKIIKPFRFVCQHLLQAKLTIGKFRVTAVPARCKQGCPSGLWLHCIQLLFLFFG